MTGYTRQSVSDIIDGLVVSAGPLNDEFNALESAMNSITGHPHDGSTGGGPKINLTTSVTGILPVANGGTGAANLNGLVQITGAQTITGAKTISINTATTQAAYLTFSPTDATTGKPNLVIRHPTTATQWDILLFDGTNSAGTINFISTGLTWNSNQLADLVTTQTFSGLKTVSLNTATTSSDYFRFSPTDTGTGKPYLAVNKSATAAQWNISLWDGTNSAGTINFGASTGLTWNGNQIADLSTSQTFTNKTYSGGTFAGTTGGNLTLSGLANIAINTATTAQDYIHFTPTDVGTGKPYLAVGKSTTAAQWNIGLFDGTNSAGIINFSCGTSLNWNGVQLVDLSTAQTLTNKTITRPTITLQDSTTTFQDNGDNTKQMQFELSGISTATTRTITIPNVSDTMVTLGATQTLTNKTLTSPTISGPTISGTLTASGTITLSGTMSGGTMNPTTLQQGGSQAYVRSNVLAAVSQSGGVPTGGLMERGSNANGEYVKYADGLMICTFFDSTGASSTTALGNIFCSAQTTWTFPATFIAAPSLSGSAETSGSTGEWVNVASFSAGVSATYRLYTATSSAGAKGIRLVAIGRWF